MKKAFTLAEALITVAIIGIVAVLLLPHLGNATPDENKIKFLKVYDALSQVVESLANDESLYARKLENKEKNAEGNDVTVTYDTSKYPLINFDKPTDSDYGDTKYSASVKFCNLLMEGLSGDQNVACSDSATDLKDFDTKYNFSTQDGSAWLVQPYTGTDRLPTAEKDGNYYATVIVDINGVENAPNAQYNASTPNVVPDRFTFYVNGNGQVFPADVYSQMYIASRTVWNKNKSQDTNKYTAVNTEKNKNFEVPIAIRKDSSDGNDEQESSKENDTIVSTYNYSPSSEEYGKIIVETSSNSSDFERTFRLYSLNGSLLYTGTINSQVDITNDEIVNYASGYLRDAKYYGIMDMYTEKDGTYSADGTSRQYIHFNYDDCVKNPNGLEVDFPSEYLHNKYILKCGELKDDENEYDFGHYELTFEYSKNEGTKIYARAVTALDEFGNDATKPCAIYIAHPGYKYFVWFVTTDKEKKLIYTDESTKGKNYSENEPIIYSQSCTPQETGGYLIKVGDTLTPKDFFGTNYGIRHSRYYGQTPFWVLRETAPYEGPLKPPGN